MSERQKNKDYWSRTEEGVRNEGQLLLLVLQRNKEEVGSLDSSVHQVVLLDSGYLMGHREIGDLILHKRSSMAWGAVGEQLVEVRVCPRQDLDQHSNNKPSNQDLFNQNPPERDLNPKLDLPRLQVQLQLGPRFLMLSKDGRPCLLTGKV